MAFVERYVTDAAGGGGDGTSGTPWTLAEALTNAVAADRVNIQSDGAYSLGADIVSNAGSIVDMIRFRGYNSSIGDLEGLGWNSDGSLNTTNFPAITLTGTLTSNAFVAFEALNFVGALSSQLIGGSAEDNWSMLQCKVLNTQNNASASCVRGDNGLSLIGCDLECSGASHSWLVNYDLGGKVIGCLLKGVAASILCMADFGTLFYNNVVIGSSGTGTGISLIADSNHPSIVLGNTFYDLGTCITLNNAAWVSAAIIGNNHATDCGKWIDALYAGTAETAVIEFNNRTRDNTTPRTGLGDGINVDEVTTDTGGIATDYTDAGAGDLTLISAAPGKAAAMRQYMDCGGLQRQEPAGGGGLLVHPGMSGGARG